MSVAFLFYAAVGAWERRPSLPAGSQSKQARMGGAPLPPTTVLNKKAADMISRLCSKVESFRVADSYALAEKLFLVRFDNRAATGIRGVLSPRAPG